jgi:hypothetical protein
MFKIVETLFTKMLGFHDITPIISEKLQCVHEIVGKSLAVAWPPPVGITIVCYFVFACNLIDCCSDDWIPL